VDAELLHLLPELPPLLLEELRPVVLGRVAQHLADHLELVDLGVALEQRDAHLQKLSDDAADGPHVHCATVLLDLEQQFRSSVPEGDYFPGERTMRFFCIC
jgi:hypothetical protein